MNKLYPLLVLLALIACGAEEEQQEAVEGRRLNIVCTTGMVADLVNNIGGERVRVTRLLGPGTDPHGYEVSPEDLERLQRADLIFYNGLHLEEKMQEIFDRLATDSEGKEVVAVAEGLPAEMLRRPAECEGNPDPHVWFDVHLWKMAIDRVIASLGAVDPEGLKSYHRNGAAYHQRLEELHLWIREQIEKVPADRRVLVTAHDAFGYFGRAYGMEVVGLQGISIGVECETGSIERLVDTVVGRRIGTIFAESSVPQREIEMAREGCRERGFEVVIGGTLYADAPGEPGSGADTYIGMVTRDVEIIVGALK